MKKDLYKQYYTGMTVVVGMGRCCSHCDRVLVGIKRKRIAIRPFLYFKGRGYLPESWGAVCKYVNNEAFCDWTCKAYYDMKRFYGRRKPKIIRNSIGYADWAKKKCWGYRFLEETKGHTLNFGLDNVVRLQGCIMWEVLKEWGYIEDYTWDTWIW